MYLVYKTDNQHSYASRDIIAIASTPETAIFLCQAQANKEQNEIDKDQLFNLSNLYQTQGYSGEGEFQFEKVDIDELI